MSKSAVNKILTETVPEKTYNTLKNAIERYNDREKKYESAVFFSRAKKPGEKVMPTDINEFIKKRASLDTKHTKIAVDPSLVKALKRAITPKSMLVGGSLIGLGTFLSPSLEHLGENIRRSMTNPVTRTRMDDTIVSAYSDSVGKELGKSSVGLLSDVLAKAVSVPATLNASKERAGIFDQLRKEDDVIATAEPQQLTDAYHTMTKFAPTLSTDKNAVKTFLREAVLYGTGPNFMTIKQIADTENAITEEHAPARRF